MCDLRRGSIFDAATVRCVSKRRASQPVIPLSLFLSLSLILTLSLRMFLARQLALALAVGIFGCI